MAAETLKPQRGHLLDIDELSETGESREDAFFDADLHESEDERAQAESELFDELGKSGLAFDDEDLPKPSRIDGLLRPNERPLSEEALDRLYSPARAAERSFDPISPQSLYVQVVQALEGKLPFGACSSLAELDAKVMRNRDTGSETLIIQFDEGNKVRFSIDKEARCYVLQAQAPSKLTERGTVVVRAQRNKVAAYERSEFTWRGTDTAEAKRALSQMLLLSGLTAKLDRQLERGAVTDMWVAADTVAYTQKAITGESFQRGVVPTFGRDLSNRREGVPFALEIVPTDLSRELPFAAGASVAGPLLAVKESTAFVLVPSSAVGQIEDMPLVMAIPMEGAARSLRKVAIGEWVAMEADKSENGRFLGYKPVVVSPEAALKRKDVAETVSHEVVLQSVIRRATELALNVLQGKQERLFTPAELAVKGDWKVSLLREVAQYALETGQMYQGAGLDIEEKAGRGSRGMRGFDPVVTSPLYAVAENKAYARCPEPTVGARVQSRVNHLLEPLRAEARSAMAHPMQEVPNRIVAFEVFPEQTRAVPTPASVAKALATKRESAREGR